MGLAGTASLALGGATAGALPVRVLLAPASVQAALGLVGVYFGVVLLVAAWVLLGRLVRGPEPPTPRALLLVLAVWAAPLLLAPPLFSRDVYSYLAQGAMVEAHMDVYAHGPAQLGGPLADEVAPMWRHTGAPYGPAFLALASALSGMTRGEVPAGLLGMRLVALVGVALMALALPRLARHSGADPAAALWLGALNPLVLLHLVAGAHNDALMLGLLGLGLVAARGRRPVVGAVLVTLAALVKAPAALGLPAVVALRVRSGRRPLPAVLTTAAASAATAVALAASALAAWADLAASRLYWTEALWDTGRVGRLDYVSNQSLQGVLARLGETGRPLWAAAVLLTLCVWAWRGRRAVAAGDWAAAFALTGAAACLVSPITWVHHLVWLLPSFAVLVRAGHARVAAALYAVLCTSVVWLWFDDASGLDGFLGGNLCTWISLGLLLGVPVGQSRAPRLPLARSTSATTPAPSPESPATTAVPDQSESSSGATAATTGVADATGREECGRSPSSEPTGSTRPAAAKPQSSRARASSYTVNPPSA
ncbi:polyprenol phosphomannose-dependent alpha 1,6 mannosyltransferase MptB [Streptomyces flaveolus]|uniref:polyprenol phosphomannose-dependent alpha 1,6 mannosyltransferase MptB n=1 Tax=Streptomyces flaveolus TaxID=67297 RepID=UPI0033AD2AFF